MGEASHDAASADGAGWSRDAQEAREAEEAPFSAGAAGVTETASATAEFDLAGVGRRTLGFLIDATLMVTALSLLSVLLPFSGDDWYWISFLIGYFAWLTFPLFFAVILPVAVASSARVAGGRTPGKVVAGTGIRTASEGDLPAFRQLFGRECRRGGLIVLFAVPGVFDHVAAVRDPLRQTWHDRGAGTVVTREARGGALGAAISLLASVIVFAAVLFVELGAAGGLVFVWL